MEIEIREFFIIAFSEAPALGEQSADPVEHLTLIGFIRPDYEATQEFTVSEHVERIALRRLELPGRKNRKLGRHMVTLLDDPTGELNAAKDELYAALMADGYICTRSSFYTGDYKPHVSIGPDYTPPGQPHPRKLESFALNSLSVTESRFDLDYEFQGAEVISTRSL